MEEGELFRDENTSLEHSVFTEALCTFSPPKQQGGRSNNLWTAQKPKGPGLVPTQAAPTALCPGKQQVETHGSREISGQMCKEMSKPPTMIRCQLQKYFKSNEEETIKSRFGGF